MGRSYLHNLPFTHKQRLTTELEVGSMGKGASGEMGCQVEKNTAAPNLGCLGRTAAALTQEESEDQKWFGKARTIRGAGTLPKSCCLEFYEGSIT